MADRRSEHLIRIIVQGVNRLGDVVDKGTRAVEKHTGAVDRQTKAMDKGGRSAKDAQRDYESFTKAVRDGEKDYESATFGLKQLAAEMDRLARKEPVGSRMSEDLHRSAVAARELSDQLRVAHETERKLGEEDSRDRVRREQERQRSLAETVKREQATEADGARNRKGLLADILDEVRRDHDERRRMARDLADFEVRETARVESARASSRADRTTVEPRRILGRGVPIQQPTLRQRAASVLRRLGGGGGLGGDLRDTDRSARGADSSLSRLERTVRRLSGSSDHAAFSIARVDNNLRGLLVVGVIAFSQQLVTAFLSIVSAALAVASAAAQAGAAVGGAFVAGVGQAIPTIGLLVAAFGRIGAVFKAVQLFNVQATKAGYDQAQASDAQAAAADRVASAQEQVASASQRVRDATVALTDAREQARRKIQDLNIAERDASRTQFEAGQAITRAVASGDVGALEGLRNRRDQANIDAGRARTDASSAREKGVDRAPEVLAAVRDLDEANAALRRSRRELDAAGRSAEKAATVGSAADRSLEQALAQLTPAELALYQAAKRIQARYRTLFRPITDIIVRAFTRGVDTATRVMGDSRVVDTARTMAEAVAHAMGRINSEASSNRSLNFFKVMGDEASRNIPLLTTIAIRVNRIFSAIALASGPALRAFLRFFSDLAGQGERATNSKSGIAKLERFFLKGEKMAESFIKLGLAITQLFAAVAGAGGAKTGQDLVDSFTKSIQNATRWVQDNRDKVKQFFEDSAETVKSIAGGIFAISQAAVSLFSSDKVIAFVDVFEKVLLPALVSTATALGTITYLLSKFLALPGVSKIAAFALSMGLLFKAFTVFSKLLIPFAGGLARVLGGIRVIGPLFLRAASLIRVAAAIATGPWGLLIAAVITGIVLLDKKFHFIRPTIKFLGELFKTVFGEIKDVVSEVVPPVAHFLSVVLVGAFNVVRDVVVKFIDVWVGLQTMLLGGLSTLASVGSHLPFVGDKFKALAGFIDAAREKIDGYRESLRNLGKEHDKAPSKVERLRGQIDKLKTRLSLLKDGTDEYRATAERLRRKQGQLNDAMADAEDKGKKGARGPRAMDRSARSAATSVGGAFDSIAKNFNKLAKGFGGVKPVEYKSVGGVFGALVDAKATGGYIGRKGGPQGPDRRLIAAGDGEAVLAVPHQGPVEEGLRLRSALMGGPSSLDQLFSRVKGYVGAFATGGRVDFGGHPTNVNSSVRRLVALMQGKFPLSVTSTTDHSTYTTSGNLSDHPAGNAVDLSGTTSVMYRAAEYVKRSGLYRRLKQGIHNPNLAVNAGRLQEPPGQFAGTVWAQHADHIHLAIAGAIGKLTGLIAQSIKAPRISGPDGRLRDLATRAVAKITRAANRRLDAIEPDVATPGGAIGSVKAQGGDADVIKAFRRAIRATKARPVERLALWEAGIVESGLRNLNYGDADSLGALQERVSLFGRAHALNPFASAVRFLRDAISRRPWRSSAGLLAAAVQRPAKAYIGRYDQVADRARQYLEQGGPVWGRGPRPAMLHGGEHVWTTAEVIRAGGHKVMFALRQMLGGGGQGRVGSYASGGRTLEIGDSLGVGTAPFLRRSIDGLTSINVGGKPSSWAVDVLRKHLKDAYTKVILDVGTNDYTAKIFAKSLERARKLIGSDREIVLSRIHGGRDVEAKNKVLQRFADANSNVTIVAPSLRGLASDGIHFTSAGYKARAKTIAGAVRDADGEDGGGAGAGIGYRTPGVFDTSLAGILRELSRARKAIGRLRTRSSRFATTFGRSIEQITDDGGLLDQGTAALERLTSGIAVRLKRLTYRVTKSGLVIRRLSLAEQAQEQLGGIDKQISGLRDLRSAAAGSLRDVDRRLGVLRRGGVTAKERKAYETLVAARRNLVARIEALDGQVADAIESRFQAQEQVIQTAVDAVNTAASRRLARADLTDRVAALAEGLVGGRAQAFGLRGQALQQRGETLRQQRDALGPLLARAQQQGSTEIAADLVAQIEDLNVAIAENSAAVTQNTVAYRAAEIDSINRAASRRLAAADLVDRAATVVEAFGNPGAAFGMRGQALASRRSAITAQRDALVGQLAAAQGSFAGTVAEQQQIEDLIDQISDLNVQLDENTLAVAQNTVAARQSSIDAINRSTQRRLTSADLTDRVAALVEAAGNAPRAFDLRRGALLARRGAISDQRARLIEQLGLARASFGGTTAEQQQIDDLTDQISDLSVQLDENTKALDSNTVAARQAAIDAITGRGGFLGGVFSGLSGIVKSLGTLAGSEDVTRLRELAQAAGTTLQQTGAGLRDQLLRGFGIDLRGLSPQALVDALKMLNFDRIEANFSVEQRQQFESLISAIIENASAVVDNTQQLADLNGSRQQSFSTTAWQLFREAIFNGSGGLLPQYRFGTTMPQPIASSASAGALGSVRPGSASASGTNLAGGETVNLYVTNPTETADPQWLGETIATKRSLARASR